MYATQKTKPGEIQAIKIQTLVDKYQATVESYGRLTFVIYQTEGAEQRPVMALFIGKQKNTYSHKVYKDFSALSKDMLYHKEQEDDINGRKEENRAKLDDIKVGTIFYTSWGYEQTNVEFYQVVSRSGLMVEVRELCAEIIDGHHDMSGMKIPKIGEFYGKEIMKRKLMPSSYRTYINISQSQTGYLWDGEAKSYSSYH